MAVKKKRKQIEYVCERCGNPVMKRDIKCKWCKHLLKPDYYKNKSKEN